MSKWPMVTLGEVATVDRKVIAPESITDGTHYIGLEHIERGGRIFGNETIGEFTVASAKHQFTAEHILYGKLRPNLGKIAQPSFGGVCSTDILPIRVGDRLDRGYLFHYLSQPRMVEHAASCATGANLPRLSPVELLKFQIPLPPFDDQRRIAAILEQASSLTDRIGDSLCLLDELAESIATGYMNSPEAELMSVESVCDRITVGVVIKPASHYVAEGVPALRSLNIAPGRIDSSNFVYFSHESNDGPLAKSKLLTGDVVVVRTGNAGTAAVIPPELDGCNAIDLIVTTPNPTRMLPIYFEHVLNSSFGKRLVGAESRGQIQQHFNVGSLKTSEIPVPPLAEQRDFALRLGSLRRLKNRLQEQRATHLDLISSLQARAFRGEL